jgi:UDP-glucose 4-epimerase
MTVLVTGGAGYIGSHTCIELLEAGHNVVIVDNLCNSNKIVVDRIEELSGKKPVFYEFDVTNVEKMETVFREQKNRFYNTLCGFKSSWRVCKKAY